MQLGPEHVPDADVALLYNSGLQALLLKQYDTALHCFQVRLALRLGLPQRTPCLQAGTAGLACLHSDNLPGMPAPRQSPQYLS